MKTLLLKTSLFGDAGQSSRLAAELLSGRDVVVRDLARDPVPHLSAERFQAFLAKPAARTSQQDTVVRYSNELIDELKGADTIVIALPMYNFGVPSTLKAYFDHIARADVTFRYTASGSEGLLTGKKAIVLATRGGYYGPGDLESQYVRQFLAFLGITDVQFVYAEGLAIDADKGLAGAREQIARLNASAPVQYKEAA